MARNDDWGISLCPDSSSRLSWSATGDLFFTMVDYFEAPEQEDFLVSRCQIEAFIRDLLSDEIPFDKEDDEFFDLNQFFAIAEADQFWLCAWW